MKTTSEMLEISCSFLLTENRVSDPQNPHGILKFDSEFVTILVSFLVGSLSAGELKKLLEWMSLEESGVTNIVSSTQCTSRG